MALRLLLNLLLRLLWWLLRDLLLRNLSNSLVLGRSGLGNRNPLLLRLLLLLFLRLF